MKRSQTFIKILCLALTLAFAASFAACASSAPEAPAEEPEATPELTDEPVITPEPTEEPVSVEELIESLLPDWEPYRVKNYSYSYTVARSAMVDEYISRCKGEGFGYLRQYENSNTAELLYRDDIWIEITDNARTIDEYNPGYITLHFRPSRFSGGVSAAEAMELIGADGTGHTPAAAIDRSPEGMYEATGMQLYYLAYDLRPGKEENTGYLYITRYFLVGGGEELYVDQLLDYGFGDLDGDGKCEVVLWGVNGISSRLYMTTFVYRSEGGRPVLARHGYLELEENRLSDLVSHDGKLYYVTAPRLDYNPTDGIIYGESTEYEIHMENNFLTIDDPDVLFRCEDFANDEYELPAERIMDIAWEMLLEVHKYHRQDSTFNREDSLLCPNYTDTLPPCTDVTVFFYPNRDKHDTSVKDGSVQVEVRCDENGEWSASLGDCRVSFNVGNNDNVDKGKLRKYLKELDWSSLGVTEAELKKAGYAFSDSDGAAQCAALYLGERIAAILTGCSEKNWFRCESARAVGAEENYYGGYSARIAVWVGDEHMFMRGFHIYQDRLYGGEEFPEFTGAMTFSIPIEYNDGVFTAKALPND